MKYVFLLFSLLLVAGCSDTSTPAQTQSNQTLVDALPEEQLAQAISTMNSWTSYQAEYNHIGLYHPELDSSNSEIALSYVKEPLQVAKLYKDNYFGGQFESYFSQDAGFSVKNDYGDGVWQTVDEVVSDNELLEATSALLQLLVQAQNTASYTSNTAELTITEGDFTTIMAQIEKVDALHRKLATPADILVNIHDEENEPTYSLDQLDATISFDGNLITGYSLSAVLDVGLEEYGPGQLDVNETFRSVNTLTDIAVPTN